MPFHFFAQNNHSHAVLASFPSSQAFEDINSVLQSSDAERKDAIKQGNAVFAFTLKNKAGETESWHIDLKNNGEVGKGLGEKPTGEHILTLEGCVGGRMRELEEFILTPWHQC